MRNYLLPIWLLLALSATGQYVHYPVYNPYPVNAAYHKQSSPFTFLNNPALLTGASNISVAVYGEKRWWLNDAGNYNAVLILPTQTGNFGLKTTYFGQSSFNQTQLGVSYGRRITEQVNMGISINYYQLSVQNYGNQGAVNFELGTTYNITPALKVGMAVYNPLRSRLSERNERIAASYRTGFGYSFSNDLFAGIDIIKETLLPVNFHLQLLYKPMSLFSVRGGALTQTGSFYTGLGFALKDVQLDIMAQTYQRLGVSSGIQIQYQFKHTRQQ